MFLFIVPLTPAKMRNRQHDLLWETTRNSLLAQRNKNWKALIVGDKNTTDKNENFIYLEADNFTKVEKLKIALKYIEDNPSLRPDYIIRLDADDLISPVYLSEIESLNSRYDLYYDPHHVCIDPVYLKISHRKNNWIANTAIHKYEHAITRCGPQNEILFLQDHDQYWHRFYADKNVFKSVTGSPLYYRVLTPFSITGDNNMPSGKIAWDKHLLYLNSYGPWLAINKTFIFYNNIKLISNYFQNERPFRGVIYWAFNILKHYKNSIFNLSTLQNTVPPSITDVPSIAFDTNKTCSKCILSTKDTLNINFDRHGVCNYCNYYDYVTARLGNKEQKELFLKSKIREIQESGKGKEYDCILGVSGGVDSSYLAYWAKENKLKPLIVHFDNGWNSELAVQNIQNICNNLGFSLNTYVIDWEEFKQLQLAYLRAGVIDIEALTDHAIIATIYKIAKKYNLRYTINGFNYATEAIMPKGWVFDKTDFTNIRDINKKFGTTKIKAFPHITFLQRFWFDRFLKIESIRVLNYMDYNKEVAKKLLMEKLGWRDYGGKHYESVFTKFYQSYILPVKFGVDKRKAHLANLICSNQITKQEAYEELAKPLYDPETLQNEKAYVLKKFGLSEKEFDTLMREKPRKHTDFKTQEKLWKAYFKVIKLLRPWKK